MNFTEYDKAIIIGISLGDGYIDQRGQILVTHCEKQKEYCEYKAKLLHSVCGGNDIKVHEVIVNARKRKLMHNYYTQYRIKKQSKHFKYFRELLYKDSIKTVTKEILDLLLPISIALWWMDDGCLTKKRLADGSPGPYMLRLCTYLPKEQNILIQKYFIDKYNMKWNVVKADGAKDDTQWMLRCGQTEGRKFLNIIRDIIKTNVPTMAYKVLDI